MNDIQTASGMSLMETLLILGVVGAASALAYVGAEKKMQAGRADDALMALSQARRAIHGIESTNLDYQILSSAPESVIPDSIRGGSSALRDSPWGSVALSTNSGAKAHESYTIAYSNVPPYGCALLIAKGMQGFGKVEVNSAALWSAPSPSPDPGALSSACAGGSNQVAFTSIPMKGSMPAPGPSPTPTPVLLRRRWRVGPIQPT